MPSGAFPALLQTAFPELQSTVIFWHGLSGSEQSWPALHIEHVPPLHTAPPPEPQGVPSATLFSELHTRAPFSQAYVPVWQSLALHGPPALQFAAASEGELLASVGADPSLGCGAPPSVPREASPREASSPVPFPPADASSPSGGTSLRSISATQASCEAAIPRATARADNFVNVFISMALRVGTRRSDARDRRAGRARYTVLLHGVPVTLSGDRWTPPLPKCGDFLASAPGRRALTGGC